MLNASRLKAQATTALGVYGSCTSLAVIAWLSLKAEHSHHMAGGRLTLVDWAAVGLRTHPSFHVPASHYHVTTLSQ